MDKAAFAKETAEVKAAKRARAEWVRVFGSKPTRGLALVSQRLERAQMRLCRAQSLAAVRELWG